jgi:hypothetical protein
VSLDFDLVIDACPHCLRGDERIEFNMTHNVSPMWRIAGCYEALYESEGKKASDVLPALLVAADHMEANAEQHLLLNPPNRWGSYDGALSWLRKVITACQENPDALIRVSR